MFSGSSAIDTTKLYRLAAVQSSEEQRSELCGVNWFAIVPLRCPTFAWSAPGTQRLVCLISFERWPERQARPNFRWRCHRDHLLNSTWKTSSASSKPPLCQPRKTPPRPRTYTQRFTTPFPAPCNSTLVLGRLRMVIASGRRINSCQLLPSTRGSLAHVGGRRQEERNSWRTVERKRKYVNAQDEKAKGQRRCCSLSRLHDAVSRILGRPDAKCSQKVKCRRQQQQARVQDMTSSLSPPARLRPIIADHFWNRASLIKGKMWLLHVNWARTCHEC